MFRNWMFKRARLAGFFVSLDVGLIPFGGSVLLFFNSFINNCDFEYVLSICEKTRLRRQVCITSGIFDFAVFFLALSHQLLTN